jgi:hypothetical protein
MFPILVKRRLRRTLRPQVIRWNRALDSVPPECTWLTDPDSFDDSCRLGDPRCARTVMTAVASHWALLRWPAPDRDPAELAAAVRDVQTVLDGLATSTDELEFARALQAAINPRPAPPTHTRETPPS